MSWAIYWSKVGKLKLKNNYWHTKMYTLIRLIIRESLVEIHEQSIMYESTPENKKEELKSSITFSYIWHVDISKCMYQLDMNSVKVWWRYMLLNSNTVQPCDIFFRHDSVANLPKKQSRKSKICIIEDQLE